MTQPCTDIDNMNSQHCAQVHCTQQTEVARVSFLAVVIL